MYDDIRRRREYMELDVASSVALFFLFAIVLAAWMTGVFDDSLENGNHSQTTNELINSGRFR